jgi:integrase/recombinase XerC
VEAAAWMILARTHGEANGLALGWKANMVDRGLAPATINRRLAALRSLVKLARTLGMIPWSLEVEGLEAQTYRDTRGPGTEGWIRMQTAATGRTDPKGTRDLAILRLLHDLALRRGEVVSLDLEHLDLEAGKLAVMGKGRSARESLTVPRPTLGALRAWVTVRGTEPGPLFTSFDHAGKGSGRISGSCVFTVVRAAGKAAGLTVRPHGLRHAAITEALDATGGNVRKVQRFSRHRDIRTLEVYDDNRRDMGGEVANLVAVA